MVFVGKCRGNWMQLAWGSPVTVTGHHGNFIDQLEDLTGGFLDPGCVKSIPTPIRNPWDERYICLHENPQKNQANVGKYTIWPNYNISPT